MNKNTKIGILTVALFLSVFSFVFYMSKRCVLDGETVCYDDKTQQFRIEEDGNIKVQVESDEVKEALVSAWEKQHPEAKERLEVVVKEPLKLKEILEFPEEDIILTSQNNAAYFMDRYFDLGPDFKEVVGSKIPSQIQDAMNKQGFKFVQNSIDGWFFVYNKTLMESLGYAVDDVNKDGLPDEFESWEKIMGKSDELLESLDYVFPLTFSDQYSFYPFLTGGRWTLNFNHTVSGFGFDSREFLEGLKLIELFSEGRLSKHDKKSTDLTWAYDTALYERETLFSISHSALDFTKQTEDLEDEFVIAPFPKFEDHYLAPMGEVNGYALLNKTTVPSMGAEVLRILRSPDVLNEYKSIDDKTLVYHKSHLDDLSLEAKEKQNILAYNHHDTDSVLALEDNPKVLLKNVYLEVEFMDIISDLYDGELSREAAQNIFVERAKKWIIEKGGKVDDDMESNN